MVTAAGSNQLFTLDAQTGAVLGRIDVGWIPRGVALQSGDDGSPERAWVYNAVENTAETWNELHESRLLLISQGT